MYTKNNPTTSIDGKAAHCPTCGSYCNTVTDLDENDYCNDCRPDTKESRLRDILEKFENGIDRYEKDPGFKITIDSLVHGIGIYAVLDSVLKASKMTQDMNASYCSEINDLRNELCRVRNELQYYRPE